MCASQGVCTKPCGGAVKVKSASHGCMQCGAVRCSEVRSCRVDFICFSSLVGASPARPMVWWLVAAAAAAAAAASAAAAVVGGLFEVG